MPGSIRTGTPTARAKGADAQAAAGQGSQIPAPTCGIEFSQQSPALDLYVTDDRGGLDTFEGATQSMCALGNIYPF
jgi:hypothetical protein